MTNLTKETAIMMKRYDSISAWELRKMHGRRCRFENCNGRVCEWKISIENYWWCFICHDNDYANGAVAQDMLWYRYSWCIYQSIEDDYTDNISYKWIEIEGYEPRQEKATTEKKQLLSDDLFTRKSSRFKLLDLSI